MISNEKQKILLVDENDCPLGIMDKMEVHQKGLLHRAISVIVFNSKGEMLLQRRSLNKYHSAGKWSNTCCSHPYPDENPIDAARRRLFEEMGINVEKLIFWKRLLYRVELENNLIENELDYIFICVTDELPNINKDEVMEYRYANFDSLFEDVSKNETNYTYWFKLILKELNLQQISNWISYAN